MPFHDSLRNALTVRRDDHDRSELQRLFPELLFCSHRHYLSLRRYLKGSPERFFDRESFKLYLEWLATRDGTARQELQDYFNSHLFEINDALVLLSKLNAQDWHDAIVNFGNGYDPLNLIDTQAHPAYVRLTEGVLAPLARVLAYFSRLGRGAGTADLDIYQIAQELKATSVGSLLSSYRHTVRNGIAHGGITYREGSIQYRDKRGNKEVLEAKEMIQLTDDLVDVCNGMAAAIKVFFILNRGLGYEHPDALVIDELREETTCPWWEIQGCLASTIGNVKQLVIYVYANTYDYQKAFYSVIQTGALAGFFAPSFGRYFITIKSRKAHPGWAAFDGNRLCSLATAEDSELADYVTALEEGMVFYVPNVRLPPFVYWLSTVLASVRTNWPIVSEELRRLRGNPNCLVRNAEMHRNSWGAVLRADAWIEAADSDTIVDIVRMKRRRIVALARSHALRNGSCTLLARFLPIGFAHINVYRTDYRRRRLAGFGLGEDLVCTIRLQYLKRIKSPDIFGGTVDHDGPWRIVWNRAWLARSAN